MSPGPIDMPGETPLVPEAPPEAQERLTDALERLKAYTEILEVVAALRIALDALEFYAGPNPRREEDGGDRAIEAIRTIRDHLLPEDE